MFIPKIPQNTIFVLSLFWLLPSKKVRHRANYDSTFSKAGAKKSSRTKPGILRYLGYKLVCKSQTILWLLLTLLLCQCTTADNSPTPEIVNQKITNPYEKQSASYLAMASQQNGEEQQDSLIKAAGKMISDGQWRQGKSILAQTKGLTDAQLKEKSILMAKVALMQDNPKSSLEALSQIKEVSSLSLYHQIQYHELLALTYRGLENPVASISQRIRLESLLTDKDSQTNNQRQLWFTLMGLSQQELEILANEHTERSELKGWLDLTLISRQYRNNAKSLIAALDQWQVQFQNHPANRILPTPLDSVVNKMIVEPKQVALLLPLSGPLSGPGHSIQEGFMAAATANTLQDKAKVKSYDTAKGNIADLYQKAIADGADFVVGPLIKNQVATIASMNHPVPTLLLNESDSELQDNSYVFGLSPTAEALQVANQAHRKGYGQALVIAPANQWGTEVVKAFSAQWQAQGGRIADTFHYADKEDLNQKMRDFLQITQSAEREKKIKQLLGQQVETVTSRRQDFDMVFLLAYPSKARQIMPLLKYYYAGNVPVYATSTVYAGNANALKDKDLDGVIFCDIPWVFSHQMGARNWPEQYNSHNRLYALGKNSYELATQLNQLMLFPAGGNKETGGIFYLNSNQQVSRVFEWGQFRQGLAHSLGETA